METPIYDNLVTPYILEEHDWEVPCEGTLHHTGTVGHVIDQSASYLVICGHCAESCFVCEGRLGTLLSKPAQCMRCRMINAPSEYRIIPLDVTP